MTDTADTVDTISPISHLDVSDDSDSSTNSTNLIGNPPISDSEKEILRDLRRTQIQKAEPVKTPKKLDYYTVYYRTSGMAWMCSCCLHLNPRDAIVEMQGLKCTYNQFHIVKITLPV